MSEKTCLAVGINHYSWAPVLKCAVSDAQEVAAALAMQEYSFDVETLLDDEATTEALGKAIVKLFDGNARLKLAYFSGHGYSDDRGAYLCVPQGSHDAPGISLGWLKQAIEPGFFVEYLSH